MQEARELANDPSTDYTAAPLEVCPFSSQNASLSHLPPVGRYLCELLGNDIHLNPDNPSRNGIAQYVALLAQNSKAGFTTSGYSFPQSIPFVPHLS